MFLATIEKKGIDIFEQVTFTNKLYRLNYLLFLMIIANCFFNFICRMPNPRFFVACVLNRILIQRIKTRFFLRFHRGTVITSFRLYLISLALKLFGTQLASTCSIRFNVLQRVQRVWFRLTELFWNYFGNITVTMLNFYRENKCIFWDFF